MPVSLISSPFPHTKAMAAAAAAVQAAKAKKEDEAWELRKKAGLRAGMLALCLFGAAYTYQAFATRQAKLHHIWGMAAEDYGDSSMVRRATAATNSKKFFLDIAASTTRLESSLGGSYLENLGWRSVCAVPSPVELAGRTCEVVARPISGKDGVSIQVPDCSGNAGGLKGVMNKMVKLACPYKNATTFGIDKLLEMVNAPKVIDYIAIDNQDYPNPGFHELDIIKRFPFSKRCVHAWFVQSSDAKTRTSISNLLEVAQGCKVHRSPDQIFARCPCKSEHKSASQIEIVASGHGKSGNASAVVHRGAAVPDSVAK